MKWRKRQLWWLFIPFACCITLSGDQYFRYSRQLSAVRQIERFGGRVVTTHGDPRWIQWISGGKSLRIFEQASLVNLSQTEFTDSDMTLLHDLRGLRRLNLRATGITDGGLKQLARLTDLKALDLSETKISTAGLPHLRDLRSLDYLYLHGTSVVDADLASLRSLFPNCVIEIAASEQ